MLQTSNISLGEPLSSPHLLSPVDILFRSIAIVRRHYKLCAVVPAVFLVLAVVYLTVTPAQFTATTVMAIDPRKSATATPGASSQNQDIPVDNLTVESQTEILQSENISLKVIRDLKLLDDPDFNQRSAIGAVFGWLISWVHSSPPPTDLERERAVVEQFAKRLSVKRIGVTFMFEIGFTLPDKEKAAVVANAVANAYVDDQLQAKYEVAARAGNWLQDRLKELGKQTSAAERAVVDFRIKNNIVDTGGRLMSEQQLAELNSQLALASASASEASAKLSRIQEIMASDVPDANVTDALHNEVIVKLRNQYTDLQKREAYLVDKLGPAHQAVLQVRADMRTAVRSIRQELQRIAAGYQSDFEIGRSRVDSIQKSLADLVSKANTTNQAQIELKALDSTAQSYRTLYDTFLQRYMESVQQKSFPLTEARVITKATPPLKKSKPKTLITLIIALIGGSAVGFAAAWVREIFDRTLRTSDEVRAALGVPCISTVPMLDPGSRPNPVFTGMSHLGEVVARPMSRFAESMRAIKVAVDFFPADRKPQVIGFISALPGEGKSTISANFAALVACSGASAILVDGDLRSSMLSGRLTPGAQKGLLDLLSGRQAEGSLVRLDHLRCDFIPSVHGSAAANPNQWISSVAMRSLLEKLKARYDYVIVDLPPLVPVTDAHAAADLFDCFVMVVEWGATSAEIVQSGFHGSSRITTKTVGAVLNKVHPTASAYYGNMRYATVTYS
ncbi:Wzz/FepE/Etk N-terminal domain-containing protein [Rhodoplanes sp. Z2-YC6860]|uniref:Wzz/FepE/Etk N-terminal domain-containing protein n=1 Tax=Rhodoplanes sp. Z2-YC6860 TaxID=674703 RepID=UPI00078EE773|nr:Wzz/FepE/Etk N-terminal domain-containing protein [Rhodoplanes sp. Z2-YC6860]AMN43622.1 capsular exopolysaccharide family protein [Rhodoplanes sp. Z2-YC6860]